MPSIGDDSETGVSQPRATQTQDEVQRIFASIARHKSWIGRYEQELELLEDSRYFKSDLGDRLYKRNSLIEGKIQLLEEIYIENDMDTNELYDDLDEMSGQIFALVKRFVQFMKNGKSGRQEPEEDLPDDQNVRNEEDVDNKEVIPWNGELLLDSDASQLPTYLRTVYGGEDFKSLEQFDVAKDGSVVDKEEIIQTRGEAQRILCFHVDVGATGFKDAMMYGIKFSPKRDGFVMIGNKSMGGRVSQPMIRPGKDDITWRRKLPLGTSFKQFDPGIYIVV